MAKTAVKDAKKHTPVSTNHIEVLPDHDDKVDEIAYRTAESRGFKPSHELDDWLEAEQDLNLN
jgi:Protein of unknown function (DUF2934)